MMMMMKVMMMSDDDDDDNNTAEQWVPDPAGHYHVLSKIQSIYYKTINQEVEWILSD